MSAPPPVGGRAHLRGSAQDLERRNRLRSGEQLAGWLAYVLAASTVSSFVLGRPWTGMLAAVGALAALRVERMLAAQGRRLAAGLRRSRAG